MRASLRAAAVSCAEALRRRAEPIEAAVGLALLCAGMVLVFSVGAALILGGAVLLLSAVWPQLRRR